jgi:hypothetical protein
VPENEERAGGREERQQPAEDGVDGERHPVDVGREVRHRPRDGSDQKDRRDLPLLEP